MSRTLLSKYVNGIVANDRRFEALSLVLKHDGLKLLVMIRLCPLPYSISNGAISTFPTVQPLMFALATAAATPRLLIAIFIGSRLAVIAKSGEKMDTGTKIINWASIIFGTVLGGLTGWLIYRRYVQPHLESLSRVKTYTVRTLARSEQIEAEERASVRRHPTRSAGVFTDDPEDEAATATIIEDDRIDFLDHEGADGYRDEFTDDDGEDVGNDVFRYGDGDGEEAIGLDKQRPQR